jgi:predicted metal-dependent phosphoesterase TrpH
MLIGRLWISKLEFIRANAIKVTDGQREASAVILDLHIHSKYSGDCTMAPATILEVAKKLGLDGIAVADHLTIKGGLETRRLNADPDFLVIVGTEIETTNKEDLIGLFLTEEIQSRNAADIISEVKAQSGIVCWAHPFRVGKNLLAPEMIERLDLIEGFNSKTSASRNTLAQQLARQYSKPVIGASDAHQLEEIGNGKTLVNGADFSVTRESLARGKTQIVDSHLSYDYLDDVR